MEFVKKLLDDVKKAKEIETDYVLAKELGINRARISAYYAGKEFPNEYACLRIAEVLNVSVDIILALVRIDAEKDEERRAAWVAYYKRIQAAEMQKAPVKELSVESGGQSRNRTKDTRIFSPLLYQLS